MLTIEAQSEGPTVEADKDELDYENVTVLEDNKKTLKITN